MSVTAAQNSSQISELELDKLRPSRSLFADAWARLIRNKASVTGIVIIVFFALLAIFAPLIAPHNPLQINDNMGFLPPAWVQRSNSGAAGNPSFLFGTDTLGRDVLSRVIYGARVSMVVGFIPTTIILLVGSVVGMLAGYTGGKVDNLLMRLTDVIYAFPDLLFFIIVMISLRDTWIGQLMNGLFLLFIALAIVNWVGVARLMRGQVLSIKEKEFVEAARCVGAKDTHIMVKHILPNALGPLIVSAAFSIPGMIITEAILGYLGIGLRPATDPSAIFVTSWGVLLLEGQTAINAQPFMLLVPALCVALIVLAFTFLGDGLRDALDPRMRGAQ
ncbi:MAG: ABC transporter permease [Anaerolineales bacterium]|jgi:oligopeptide transport system permease protein|nr:ABC transporter permease [Anaerolineales bacterium]